MRSITAVTSLRFGAGSFMGVAASCRSVGGPGAGRRPVPEAEVAVVALYVQTRPAR